MSVIEGVKGNYETIITLLGTVLGLTLLNAIEISPMGNGKWSECQFLYLLTHTLGHILKYVIAIMPVLMSCHGLYLLELSSCITMLFKDTKFCLIYSKFVTNFKFRIINLILNFKRCVWSKSCLNDK